VDGKLASVVKLPVELDEPVHKNIRFKKMFSLKIFLNIDTR